LQELVLTDVDKAQSAESHPLSNKAVVLIVGLCPVLYKCVLFYMQFWCTYKMTDLAEQCSCIKVWFKPCKNATENVGKFNVALRDQTIGRHEFFNGFPNSKVV
jgi:hypothetical protein